MGKAAPVAPAPDPFFDRYDLAEAPTEQKQWKRKGRPGSASRRETERPVDTYLKQNERRLWWQLMFILVAFMAVLCGAFFLLRMDLLAEALGFATGSSF